MSILLWVKNRLAGRKYKVENGVLLVSEKGSPFVPLIDHVCKDHPEEWARLKALEKEHEREAN